MDKNITVLYYYDMDGFNAWKEIFQKKSPNINFVHKDDYSALDADIALVWEPPSGFLSKYKKLKGVVNLGQGVDHLLKDNIVPEDLPIVRLVDHEMSKLMAGWISLQVLNETCYSSNYKNQEKNKIWGQLPLVPTQNWTIGILGIGALGSYIAKVLSNYGYDIRGWSKSRKNLENVKCYYGEDGLKQLLPECRIIICLLPLTKDTKHILNIRTMKMLPKGSTIINAGRGGHINEKDLLLMIDNGHIKNASLDVFETEPLPQDHVFWYHKNITVWPHVAAQTNTETAIDQIINAINCLIENRVAPNTIDRNKGY